jgi:biotin operon repressor
MTETQETRPPSTALVEQTLNHSSEPLSADEIAVQTSVATKTIWDGLDRLRDEGAVVAIEVYPTRWRLQAET